MDDRELIRLLNESPEQGMVALMKGYAGLVWTVARSKLHRTRFVDADVEDVVSDVFSAFYLERQTFDPTRSSIRTYLSLMTRRRAIDLLRKRVREGEHLPLDSEEGNNLAAQDAPIEEYAEKRDECTRALRAIDALGEPDRTILLGKYVFDRKTKEIARALRMTPSAVDTRAHRALSKLRKQLKGGEQ